MSGLRAVFLSVHSYRGRSEGELNLDVFLGFVVPVTNSGNLSSCRYKVCRMLYCALLL